MQGLKDRASHRACTPARSTLTNKPNVNFGQSTRNSEVHRSAQFDGKPLSVSGAGFGEPDCSASAHLREAWFGLRDACQRDTH